MLAPRVPIWEAIVLVSCINTQQILCTNALLWNSRPHLMSKINIIVHEVFYGYYLCKVLNLYYMCQEQLSQFMVMLAQMPPYKSHLQCRFCQILFAGQLKGKNYLSDFNYIAHYDFCLVYSRYLSKFFSRKVH